MDAYEPPRYPAIGFLIKFGRPFAIGAALLPLLACLLAVASGMPAWLIIVGLAAMPILLLMMLSYVEMARIISDTLMPR